MTDNWTSADIGDLSKQCIVITGANSGLGLHCSKALAAAGADIVMACRNLDKGEAARAEVLEHAPGARVTLAALDLANLDSVRRFAAAQTDAGTPIDVLLNNAGVMAVPFGHTADGFEMQIGTNHFGHFALSAQLAPMLAGDARIVTLSSLAHRWTPGIDLDDIDWQQRRYRRWQAYGDSKLANLLFHFGLARRADKAGRGWTVTAAHPGYADTHLQFVAAEQKQSRLEGLLMGLGNRVLAQSGGMGALPSLYAATAPGLRSGDFIGPGGFQQMRGYPTPVGCRRVARDEALADRLWEISEELTDCRFDID